LVLVLSVGLTEAGVEFGEPDGGWTYIFLMAMQPVSISTALGIMITARIHGMNRRSAPVFPEAFVRWSKEM
jgi:hypothetical protein